MKTMIRLLAVTAATTAIAVPAISFGQSGAPLTRAQVRAQLIAVEAAGYDPAAKDDATYPDDIQEAEARANGRDSQPSYQRLPARPQQQ